VSGRILLDEMFHPAIASALAELGHDCRSVVADGTLRQRADAELIAIAVAEGRTVVTNDVIDFERLRRVRVTVGEPVPVLIYTSDAAFPRNRRYVTRLVEALDAALKADSAGRHGGVFWLPPSD
jgi:predicted nuclease of predicted toxin-antitoxin system